MADAAIIARAMGQVRCAHAKNGKGKGAVVARRLRFKSARTMLRGVATRCVQVEPEVEQPELLCRPSLKERIEIEKARSPNDERMAETYIEKRVEFSAGIGLGEGNNRRIQSLSLENNRIYRIYSSSG